MLNREINLLEEYGLHVDKVSRGRGGTIYSCKEGMYLLKGCQASEKRVDLLGNILRDWEKDGLKVDSFVSNKEGKTLVMDGYQNVFLMRKWFVGRECDVGSEEEVLLGVRKLVELQERIAGYPLPEGHNFFPPKSTVEQLKKHSRELKNVYNYVGNKKQKSEFEEMFRRDFKANYEKTQEAVKLGETIEVAQCKYQLCHKDFTYHNLLLVDKDMIIVNFDNMLLDCRVSDFTQYLRKVMEKHQWDVDLGEKMVAIYVAEGKLTRDEQKDLYARMLFPMRFWKIVNHYSNMKKTRVNLRDKEKLEKFLEQEERRQQFLVFLHGLIV